MPGHSARSCTDALTMSATLPKVLSRVAASVRLTLMELGLGDAATLMGLGLGLGLGLGFRVLVLGC